MAGDGACGKRARGGIFRLLREGQTLSEGRTAKLKEIYEKYLGEDAEVDETIDDVDY